MHSRSWRTVDDCVEAFEAALAADPGADLGTFLPPAAHPHRAAALAELARVDMERAWKSGRRPTPQAYLDAYPELAARLGAVAFEHYRLRRASGEAASADEYRMYPGVDPSAWPEVAVSSADLKTRVVAGRAEADGYREWRASGSNDPAELVKTCVRRGASAAGAEVMLDLFRRSPARADEVADAVAELPEAGETFADFALVRELGRGGFGRVFLARQAGLAGRMVVLKVAPAAMDESAALARMQHTHIVPIYSAHTVGPLRGVCMPYFGATTLADVLGDLRGMPSPPPSGAFLAGSISRRTASAVHGLRTPEAGHAAETLKRLVGLGYVEAVLWIAARLAEGLAHAHERGILHRDIKPANVLLTDDGLPMLLDFNLAEENVVPDAPRARMGGTLPYMAPEQLRELKAEPGAKPSDARADLYSLGLVLLELLTGRPSYRAVTGSLEKVVGSLQDDRSRLPDGVALIGKSRPAVGSLLARCLDPDPEKRYRDASQLRDDLDRHLADLPLAHAPEPSLRERLGKWRRRHPRLALAASLVTAASVVVGLLWWRLSATMGDLGESRAAVALAKAQDAVRVFRSRRDEAEIALALREPGGDGFAPARKLVADFGLDGDPFSAAGLAPLGDDERRAFADDAAELLFALARAEATGGEGVTRAAELNAAAKKLFADAPGAVATQGDSIAGRPVTPAPPADAREAYLMASDLVQARRFREAVPFAEAAVEGDPRRFVVWFLLGLAHDRTGDLRRAESCYSACLSLRADDPRARFNRGLVRLRRGSFALAASDFSAVLRADPANRPARTNRAVALAQLGDTRGALDDATAALGQGTPTVRLLMLRADLFAKNGDAAAADRDRAAARALPPATAEDWLERGFDRMASDPAAALADFDRALALSPGLRLARVNKANLLSERLGKPAEAVPLLEAVLKSHPDDVVVRAGLAVVLARLGRREASHAQARRCLADDGSPGIRYHVAGAWAQTARSTPTDAETAIRLLAEAFRGDVTLAEQVEADQDLDSIRGLPAFARTVEAARRLRPPK